MFSSKSKETIEETSMGDSPNKKTQANSIKANGINQEKKTKSVTLIDADTEIFGDVKFSGVLKLLGSIHGDIKSPMTAKTEINIAKGGSIHGSLHIPRCTVSGSVTGNITAINLILDEESVVDGDIVYSNLDMRKGARINGTLTHKSNLESESKLSPKNKASAA